MSKINITVDEATELLNIGRDGGRSHRASEYRPWQPDGHY